MRIERIELKGYKPLAHCGTSFISIDINSDILTLIGNNGSGKSKLLSEVTPLPSVSTDYESDGYKHITLTHGGVTYDIWSSFDGKKGTHSFLREDIELNDSNTSTVQQELCESYLGLTPIIRDIITGAVDICNMTRGERKQFTLACYPSNLTFILQHHRKVLSELKAVRSNLKLMNAKKAELEESMVTDEIFKGLESAMFATSQLKQNILRADTVYRSDITHLKQHEQYDPSVRDVFSDEVVGDAKLLRKVNLHLRNIRPELFNVDNHNELIRLGVVNDNIDKDLNTLSHEMHDVRSEIDKFEQMSSEMSGDIILDYENRLADLTLRIGQLSYEPDFVVENHIMLGQLNIVEVQHNLSVIHSTHGEVLTPDEYATATTDLRILISEQSSRTKELERILKDKTQHEHRMDRFNKTVFRNGCTLACQAKDVHNDEYEKLREDYEHYEEVLLHRSAELNSTTYKVDKLTKVVENASETIKSVQYVQDVIRRLELDSFVETNISLKYLLNNNPMFLYNHIVKLNDNTSAFYSKQELEADKEELQLRLNTVLRTKAKTIDMMKGSIDSKRDQLDDMHDRHTTTSDMQRNIANTIATHKRILSNDGGIVSLKNEYTARVLSYVINKKIELLESIVSDLVVYNSIVEEEQIGIKATLKDSESIKIRLEQEIMPTLVDLSKQHDKLVKLEKALSPTSGLPHVYMVRFINQLIHHTNLLIRQVWNYEMELDTLKEDKPLDFNLPIKLHGSNNALKDISMLSKGQKECINLTFTFALFITMDLGKSYPIKLDEPDSGFVESHRSKLLGLFNSLQHADVINQLMLVNHFHSLVSSLPDAQIVVLDSEGIILPNVYNVGVVIE